MPPSNLEIAELLARRAEETEGQRRRAYLRSSTSALMWPEEAADLVEEGRPLTELTMVGDRLAARIEGWIEDPPAPVEPPEVRRGFMSFAQARSLLDDHDDWRAAIRSDLQMHTVGSDGKATLEEMALAAAGKGYDYVAITDHTRGLKVAGGMEEEDFAAQARAIDALNDKLTSEGMGFRVLRSAEVNLDISGRPDMEDSFLAGLEVVVGSFHSQLRTGEDQTARYVAAVTHPRVDILGHPRGRRFNSRRGLDANWDEVFAAAADAGTALEINSHPHRQDLDVGRLELARAHGALISIGTDAHSTAELFFSDIGIAAALRASIPRERIVNTWPRERLLEWAGDR